MPSSTWSSFEAEVRSFAAKIWMREAAPDRIAGVDMDCVLRINPELAILIEITEIRDLQKVREDVSKLITAKNHLFHVDQVFARCFCVVNAETVTQGMIDAGAALKVKVLSMRQFKQMFFSFDRYESARKTHQFGSTVDPVTGASDELPYVKVKYAQAGYQKKLDVDDICSMLLSGKKVVLIGEYGSGKSRCVREVFHNLSSQQNKTNSFPIAIDLRHNWGLRRYQEIIRRHFDDLGLDDTASEVLRVLPTGAFLFLLDGFDEIGSQSWSTDTNKLRAIRATSLEGVKELIQSQTGGLLITGRSHYFNNDDEMFSSLGLDREKTVVLYSKEEFEVDELRQYFSSMQLDVDLPNWLPRRPLICKTIAELEADSIERMFEAEGGDVEFWHHFIGILCRRDVKIHSSLDADTLFRLLKALARVTRAKTADVGPLTLSEIQQAFEKVVGQPLVEQASAMLQRLPGLGRVKAESDDRQFLDVYILDGLRAVDMLDCITSFEVGVEEAGWRNPLDALGQRILAHGLLGKEKLAHQMAIRCTSGRNRILASDIVAALLLTPVEEVNFASLFLDEGHFFYFDASKALPKNLHITNSTFSIFIFPSSQPSNFFVKNSLIDRAYGLASPRGVPAWIENSPISTFESVENVSRIRQIGLSPSHEVLVAIIRKTFFQKGAGRKEEALVRGLGQVGRSGLVDRVLGYLLTHGVLERFKGDEGWVYKPNRALVGRMDAMLSQLALSNDPIWSDVAELS